MGTEGKEDPQGVTTLIMHLQVRLIIKQIATQLHVSLGGNPLTRITHERAYTPVCLLEVIVTTPLAQFSFARYDWTLEGGRMNPRVTTLVAHSHRATHS